MQGDRIKNAKAGMNGAVFRNVGSRARERSVESEVEGGKQGFKIAQTLCPL